MAAQRPDGRLAGGSVALQQAACDAQQVAVVLPEQAHVDLVAREAVQRPVSVGDFLMADLAITKSHSRPYTPTDRFR